MKRGGPLRRLTPLKRRAPLRVHTPPGQKPPRRKRPHPESRAWLQTKKWVKARANHRCEARIIAVCKGRAEHVHHIQLRSRGGSDDMANLLAVCHACHGWIHGNPAEATRRGFMRSAWP